MGNDQYDDVHFENDDSSFISGNNVSILNNVSFENLNATTKLVNFLGGSLTDCTINNCISKYLLLGGKI